MRYEVCVNSYVRYNEGKGLGEWIELGRDWWEIAEELESLGFDLEGYDEELFIIDDNGLGCGEANPYYINSCLEAIDEDEEIMFLACLELIDFEDVCEMFNNRTSDDIIFYECMSLVDVAFEIADELLDCRNCPDIMSRYFDYERFARDLGFEGYIETKFGVILLP